MRLLGDALREAGAVPVALQGYLSKVANREGVAGTLTLDQDGDSMSSHILKEVLHGKLIPAAAPAP